MTKPTPEVIEWDGLEFISIGDCICRWTFRLGQAIRFPDPKCPVHGAKA